MAKGDGESRRHKATYRSWWGAIDRCRNQKSRDWERYGGRGITVCERWMHSFENFLEDMGERPPGTSIDRIDNNGNYEPGNCRWATPVEQSRNSRGVKLNHELANAIRVVVAAGMKQNYLARGLGLHPKTVKDIVNGLAWEPGSAGP